MIEGRYEYDYVLFDEPLILEYEHIETFCTKFEAVVQVEEISVYEILEDGQINEIESCSSLETLNSATGLDF